MRINYLKQLQAFRDYQLFETKLSSGQVALWYALVQINNKCAWIEEFTASNQTLETLSGLSKSGILKSRNALKQLGLIDFKTNGQRATTYVLSVLYQQESNRDSNQDSTQVSNRLSTQVSNQDSNTLNKQDLDINETSSFEDDEEEISNNAGAHEQLEKIFKIWSDNLKPLNASQGAIVDAYVNHYGFVLVNQAVHRTIAANPDSPMSYLEVVISDLEKQSKEQTS